MGVAAIGEITTDLYRIATWFWDRSTKETPERDDGFADGAPLFWFFNHRTWLSVRRQKVTGVFHVRDISGASFDLLDARKLDYRLMTEEFFQTLTSPVVYAQ